MRTSKSNLVSDELKPVVGKIIRENRIKYNYSLEDLSQALEHKKNRQTLHKYETGLLNIPYDIFAEICRIFNIDTSIIDNIDISQEEKEKLEKRFIKDYVKSSRLDANLTQKEEKIITTYKNASYEAQLTKPELTIRLIDDSMEPYYKKNDKVYFKKQEDYKNGDDIVIAIKNNILSVRRLYKYPKGIILQAMNPKHPTMNINVISNEMILGKVTSIHREIK